MYPQRGPQFPPFEAKIEVWEQPDAAPGREKRSIW